MNGSHVPQWGSSVHKRERKSMIRKFQDLSKQRSLRVSFISGDVHLAAVGLLYRYLLLPLLAKKMGFWCC